MCVWVPKSHLSKQRRVSENRYFPNQEDDGRVRCTVIPGGHEAPGGSGWFPRPLGTCGPALSLHRTGRTSALSSCLPMSYAEYVTGTKFQTTERHGARGTCAQQGLAGGRPTRPARPPICTVSPLTAPPVPRCQQPWPQRQAAAASSGSLMMQPGYAGGGAGGTRRGGHGPRPRGDSHAAVGEGQAVGITGQALLLTVIGAGGRGEGVAGADVVGMHRLPPGPAPAKRNTRQWRLKAEPWSPPITAHTRYLRGLPGRRATPQSAGHSACGSPDTYPGRTRLRAGDMGPPVAAEPHHSMPRFSSCPWEPTGWHLGHLHPVLTWDPLTPSVHFPLGGSRLFQSLPKPLVLL